MEVFDLINSSSLNVTITGPLAPYQFVYTSEFVDELSMIIKITMQSNMVGEEQEKYKIMFATSEFLSIYGANLKTEMLTSALNKIAFIPDAIGMIGSSMNSFMSFTLVALMASNVLLGQSSELMWGFLNTMQVMLFFPVLQLYFPDHLANFFTFFSSSRMQIDILPVEIVKSDVEGKINLEKAIDMEALNERWESIEYESTSIILNADEVFYVLMQGVVACA